MPSTKYMYEVQVPTFLLLTQDNYSFLDKQEEKIKSTKTDGYLVLGREGIQVGGSQ